MPQPVLLLDDERRTFCFCSTRADWLELLALDLIEAIDLLLLDTVSSQALKDANSNNVQGPHFPCVIGHYRQYSVVHFLCHFSNLGSTLLRFQAPCFAGFHSSHMEAVEVFLKTPAFIRLE